MSGRPLVRACLAEICRTFLGWTHVQLRGEHLLPYCSKCGKFAPDDALFCSSCGTEVPQTTSEEVTVPSDDLIERVKALIHEGNVTRIIIKDEKGKTLLEIPATVGLVGVLLAPWLAALGVIAALATKCRITVERREERRK
jgi:CBS domain-containing protein